ncbi:MAG TPA: hypothetical protein PKV96_02450 [Candidatus Saccharimonas sp.]|nr:hypothetical protein [Candidatus Saccharimonas sp.]
MPAATTHESVDPTRPPHEADVAGELLTPPLEQKIGQQTIDTHALDAALTAEHINAITVKAPSIVDQYRYFSKANTAKQSKARSSYYSGFIEPLEQLIDTYYSTGKAYGEMCSDFEKYLPKKNVEFMNLVKIEVQGILMRNAVAAYCAANELSFALPSQDQIMLGANAVVNGNALRVYIGTDKKRGVIPQYQLYVDSRGLEELHVYPDMIRDSSIAFLLTSINAKRTQKTPTVSQKHTVPHKVKGHVVDIHQDPHARTTPIIASMPTHTVGLVENYQESPYKYPDDIVNTAPEQILSMIINDALEGKLIDGYKLTREDAQKLIIGSIDIDDPGYITTLSVSLLTHVGLSLG